MNNYFICFQVSTHTDNYLDNKFVQLDYLIEDKDTLYKIERELKNLDRDARIVTIINFQKL